MLNPKRLKENANRIIGMAIVLMFFLALLPGRNEVMPYAGSSKPVEPEVQPWPRSIRTSNGETIIIESKPKHIVALTLGTAEILLEMVPRERLAGIDKIAADSSFSNISDRCEGIRLLGQDTESIIALQPDIVFMASYSPAEKVKLLQDSGILVYRFGDFNSVDDVIECVRELGVAVGEVSRAAEMIRHMEDRLERVPADAPRLLLVEPGGWTGGANSTFDSIVRLARGRNVAAEMGVVGFRQISHEQIIAWAPDVIVVGFDPRTGECRADVTLQSAALRNVPAIRNDHVVRISNADLSSVSHHVVDAVTDLRKALEAENR